VKSDASGRLVGDETVDQTGATTSFQLILTATARAMRQTKWRAYLSTTEPGGAAGVNARDRIGKGPWQNAKGVVVAKSVEDLHSDSNRSSRNSCVWYP
jgi:hypothetical protein